ncbi:MAG: RNA 2'-phosphotransferase [Candidatus Bipolaricaulia bacterium]
MDKQLVRISKFLSLVLRHRPETIGLSLDQGGWARVDKLLIKANRAGKSLNEALLRQVVERNDKQRFSLSEDGLKIRANYGHSIPVDLGLEPLMPPEFLFHGTAARVLESIKRQGLLPRKRNHVHLSPDERTAVQVGKRHGKPIVLTIQAGRMYKHGFEFYRSGNGVWLTEQVPARYIILEEELT